MMSTITFNIVHVTDIMKIIIIMSVITVARSFFLLNLIQNAAESSNTRNVIMPRKKKIKAD